MVQWAKSGSEGKIPLNPGCVLYAQKRFDDCQTQKIRAYLSDSVRNFAEIRNLPSGSTEYEKTRHNMLRRKRFSYGEACWTQTLL